MAEVDATRACVVCGTLFARNGKVNVCSDQCRVERHREYAIRAGRTKGPQQLTCAHCSAPFVGPTNKTFCSVKCKDAERRKTPAYAQDQARWRDKNRDSIRARHKQYSSRVRAERGRGDRSGEYANKKARALGVIHAAMLWVDVQYYMAHAEALAMDAEIDRSRRARRKAERAATKELAKKPRPDGAQSAYIVALKANPAAYSKELARWRAKTLKRKTGVVMKSDGTATAAVVLGGSSCLYCDCRLTDTNRSHDHMVPVVMGGVHSAANIAPCCLQCNARKGSKDFMSFVSTLPTKDQRRAIKFYERRNGPVVQMGLCLAA